MYGAEQCIAVQSSAPINIPSTTLYKDGPWIQGNKQNKSKVITKIAF